MNSKLVRAMLKDIYSLFINFSRRSCIAMSKLNKSLFLIFVLGVFPVARAGSGIFVTCERKDNHPLQARMYHQRGGMVIHWASGMVNKLSIVNFENSIYKDQHGGTWVEQSNGLDKLILKRNNFSYNCSILVRF